MNFLREITSNYILNCAFIAWLSAQIIKTLLYVIVTKKFDAERLVGAGGMPSSHSALVTALSLSVARQEGISSPLFAIAFIVTAIVIYDAMGVRREAGEHAKVLNMLLEAWDNSAFLKKIEDFSDKIVYKKDSSKKEKNKNELKEFIGHTPLEVVGGVILGIIVTLLIPVS